MRVHKKIKTKEKLLDVIGYFEELPFYNIYIEKPKINDLFSELFFDELSVVKTDKDFRRYAMTYNVEVIDKKILYHN